MNDYVRVALGPMRDPEKKSVSVLVVEDEHLIRMDTVSSLEAQGFIVHEAGNAAEAVRCLELHDEIRLIFTDVHMPGSMDGVALAHYVRDRWPPVKIIVPSGYAKVCEGALLSVPYLLKSRTIQ